jgi:selenocysteine lyase/cysteine desulfurase
MLANQRHLFSLPEGLHYLNCAYFSPLLKSVEEAGIAGVRLKGNPTRMTVPDFFRESEALREALGSMVNAGADRIALIPAASYGTAIATHNVPVRRGQNVVIPGDEFPSNVYGWRELCKARGAAVRMVPRPPDAQHPARAWTERLLEAIDRDTAAVGLSSVHWTDGTRFDLAALGRRAREVGAYYIVDGTQSVGALPFDFAAVQPDLLVVAGYKWLLGPYQCGFVAVGDRLIGGSPIEHNWINRERSEDFSLLLSYRDGFQPGARRFDVGEHSNFITVPMLLAAARQILAWGVPAIQAYCEALQGPLAQALEDTPFRIAPAADHAAHLFGVPLPDPARAPAILEELKRRDVWVSLRGTFIRVSPHVYNTPENMLALAEVLRKAGA